jgi:hypothetical protein
MVAAWVEEEFQDLQLNDQRLNQRLTLVLDQLARRPNLSIPAATGSYNDMTAAYRLFQNPKADFASILEPHCTQTSRRMAKEPVVILVPDTTEGDFTRPHQQVRGAGPLDDSRRGVFLHLLHGFTPDGTPLGTLMAQVWTREEEADPDRPGYKSLPIEEKESFRWVEAFETAREEAQASPLTRFVCVADSEADIYEVLQTACPEDGPQEGKLDWIIRACQDRALVLSETEHQQSQDGQAVLKQLWERVEAAEVQFVQTTTIRGREPKIASDKRKRRQAKTSRQGSLEVRVATLTLRPPRRKGRNLSPVTVNAVLVREIDPPSGEEPVEWLLLTSLPVDSEEAIRRVVQYYCVRWLVEVFFRTLKSGCRVQKRRFEDLDRLLSCLAVYLIVTWRTLYVCRLGREFPDIDCEAVFEPSEWKAVYVLVHRTSPPGKPPSLKEMVIMVAQLGGYVAGKGRGDPGPQTIWLGIQRLHDISECWLAFGPETRQ